MRIAFFEIEPWEQEQYTKALPGHTLSFNEEALTADTVATTSDADIVSVFIYSHVDAAVIASMPNVKYITTRSMGYDHIDLAACAGRGVSVGRVPSYGERTVAEHAFALILSLSRKIFQAYERTEKGVFDHRGLTGFDLYGKTLGVYGCGKIGKHVVRIALAFGMKVVVCDPFPVQALAEEMGFTYVDMDGLLRDSDVVTLHAPLLPATAHVFNDAAFAKMKRGAILVNTARGGLIDTKALLSALESGVLSGAGLDVLEEECAIKEEREILSKGFPQKCDLATLMRNHLLIQRDDVIITPHIAFNSMEANDRIAEATVENINGFVAGKPVNVVG